MTLKQINARDGTNYTWLTLPITGGVPVSKEEWEASLVEHKKATERYFASERLAPGCDQNPPEPGH